VKLIGLNWLNVSSCGCFHFRDELLVITEIGLPENIVTLPVGLSNGGGFIGFF
jgi:hypothetical protein